MRSPKLIVALLALVIVSLGVLVAIGLSGTARDVESARARYIGQVGTFARAVATALADEARAGGGALAWSATAEFALREPRAERATAGIGDERGLRELVTREIDAQELTGGGEQIEKRLRDIAARDERPELAAWALTWLAARAKREGRSDDARAAWSAIVERFPATHDDHGLSRALAARSALAALDGDPLEPLATLHTELLAARARLDDFATAALADDVLARVRAKSAERAVQLELAARERTRALRFVASWPTGISDWIAQGAAGGARAFALVDDPLEPSNAGARTLVTAQVDGDGSHGIALELALLAQRVLARSDIVAWGELGFVARVEDAGGVVLAGAPAKESSYVARERVAEPLSALMVHAEGRTFEDIAAAARTRSTIVAVLAVAAALVGALAAFATLRAVRREARASHEREQFVAAVTHELKAPLASIRLLAELLERGDVEPAKVREFGARTVAESDRLARLVDSVLRFARLQQGGAALPRDSVDLGAVARAAVRSVEPLARGRGFELVVREPAGPVRALAAQDALVGAVAELVDNATKYGGTPHAIEVEVYALAGRAGIAVLDRGPGVPPEERERIFQPFHRLGDELTRERPGVGLGLALVRGVAQSLGGEARYAPRAGGGSRFTLEFEAAP